MTLRDLVIMAESAERAEWRRTAATMAVIASAAGAKNVRPEMFDPWEYADRRAREREDTITVEELGRMLGARGVPPPPVP
ncbi:MAG: hypothetical protein IPM64_17240 [Phycisphaerales bacterium]|nr:hypothetical protein [Phycisphaerales bacterium]